MCVWVCVRACTAVLTLLVLVCVCVFLWCVRACVSVVRACVAVLTLVVLETVALGGAVTRRDAAVETPGTPPGKASATPPGTSDDSPATPATRGRH